MVKQQDKRTNTVFLSLGSNLGDRQKNIETAISALSELSESSLIGSSFYESEPWGNESLNGFLNCCVQMEVTCSPVQLLEETKQIEQAIGRKLKSLKGNYENRLIDIDLLSFGNVTIDSLDLTIPHKHLKSRKFVLFPLRELQYDLQLPFENYSIDYYAEYCTDDTKCWKI